VAEPIRPQDAYVLVVEDNLNNFMVAVELLALCGVTRYEWKASGWEVVKFAERMPRIDLVLLDIGLPHEDGYAVLAKLRAHERFKDTRVVAVTASATAEELARARAAGFDGFIGKPLDFDRFPQQVRSILAGEEVWQTS
jgi:two-component system cell cycle response regulator DivK